SPNLPSFDTFPSKTKNEEKKPLSSMKSTVFQVFGPHFVCAEMITCPHSLRSWRCAGPVRGSGSIENA
ncbi:hypothetical protein, partial [Hydrogenophaga sp.]|uniref:hypothetical protein n=1 Tax=Hydrogenophaga sp. TaxID=1904254 RepID=UPI00273316CC